VYIRKEIVLESHLILKDTLKTIATFLKLSESLLHNSYILWTDTCYTPPDLVKFLISCNMDCMGKMKINRKNMPKKVKGEKKLQKGEVIEQHDGLKWSDKRNVTMILSYHGTEVQTITKWGKVKQKSVTNTWVELTRRMSCCRCT
jgi:hypothetical protein